jgi:putative PEP-CTERM system histidine kinase
VILASVAYGAAALGFLALNVLLLSGRGGDPFGLRLSVASALSCLWAAGTAVAIVAPFPGAEPIIDVLEIARDTGWLILLTGAFTRRLPLWFAILVQVLGVSLLVAQALHWTHPGVQMRTGGLALALVGLVLVEQVYRNSAVSEHVWLKYLLFGIGAQFAYDLFLYAQAELVGAVHSSAWALRGAVATLSVPCIVLAVRRSVRSSASIFISRHVIFYSTALAAVGIYLVAMATGGYYVRFVGGTWGDALQLVFLLGAAAVLVSLLWSSILTRRLRVFINKHFYRNKYDYRVEWLRFVHTLSTAAPENVQPGALQALAQVFSSPRALLYVADDAAKQFRAVASWGASGSEGAALPPPVSTNADLVQFMQRRRWIIDLDEYRRARSIYEGIELPEWLEETADLGIVAPIMQGTTLAGFAVLARPPPPFELTYEDRDLLVTMGQHIATHLAQQEANRKLAENRQFETYSRLTAFMMHDLKNSAAQLRLVASNAVKFRHQPEFVDDAMSTIDNAASRITRLLDQLRLGATDKARQSLRLHDLIDAALARCANVTPRPALVSPPSEVRVAADHEHLTSVIEHVVRNAQDATPSDGTVSVEVSRDGREVTLVVADTGSGMDPEFVRDRLFRPFDTTKGTAGMGIGAHQAREYVRSLGGFVDVQSSPGQGTRFAITLPTLTE